MLGTVSSEESERMLIPPESLACNARSSLSVLIDARDAVAVAVAEPSPDISSRYDRLSSVLIVRSETKRSSS